MNRVVTLADLGIQRCGACAEFFFPEGFNLPDGSADARRVAIDGLFRDSGPFHFHGGTYLTVMEAIQNADLPDGGLFQMLDRDGDCVCAVDTT